MYLFTNVSIDNVIIRKQANLIMRYFKIENEKLIIYNNKFPILRII
jgi:hypothetical protein